MDLDNINTQNLPSTSPIDSSANAAGSSATTSFSEKMGGSPATSVNDALSQNSESENNNILQGVMLLSQSKTGTSAAGGTSDGDNQQSILAARSFLNKVYGDDSPQSAQKALDPVVGYTLVFNFMKSQLQNDMNRGLDGQS